MASRGYLHLARDHPSIFGYRRHRASRPAGHSCLLRMRRVKLLARALFVESCNLQSAHTIRRLHGLQAHCLVQHGLVYLESGRHTWLWPIINPVEATFLSDAIVHDGIVFAVDAQIGCLYWWNLSSCNCSLSSHLYLMNTTACSFVTNLECIACL